MANVKHVSYYTNYMQSWSKELGAKPTENQLAVAHVFGRPGKQSLAVAMALRDGGVTGAQIKLASGLADGRHTPQLNHMRDLVAGREFERLPMPGVYELKLTPKGQQRIDQAGAKAEAEADKPVKAAKKVAGPRKAKVTVETVVEPAPVVDAGNGDQPQA